MWDVEFWRVLSTLAWPAVALAVLFTLKGHISAIFRRDQFTIKVAGMEISVAQAAKQSGEALADLQARVAKLESGASPPAPLDRKDERTGSISILWVDDFPTNNAFIIENLEKSGIKVRKEISTKAGLAAIEQEEFNVIISDLGRIENGKDNPFAGLDLVKAVRLGGSSVPILIFAGQRGIAHKDRLIAVGATDVTSSSVEVYRFLNEHLRVPIA